MSKSTLLVNGENCSDVVEFTTDANINMVAVNDISCGKRIDGFNSKDSSQALLSTFPCEFDHIYATSMNENAKAKAGNSEIHLLKELLLSYLDLIQQQSEQLVTKDKQINALQQENEMLKLRLERMDRRVSLQKKVEISLESPPSCSFKSNTVNINSGPVTPSPVTPVASTLATVNNGPVDARLDAAGSPAPGSYRKRKRERERDDTGSVCSGGSKRTNRSASWNSMRDKEEPSTPGVSGKVNGKSAKKEGTVRRRRKRKSRSGDMTIKKDDSILMTSFQYYSPVGDADELLDADEPKANGCVLEVPSWRTKLFTSCYTMEGTENLSEDVFERRHARLEVDERRRKRWDVQRIREQRQLERLRQREKKGEGCDSEAEEVISFWPHPEEAVYLQVSEMLPVSAFGCPLPKLKQTEFSLPWLCEDNKEPLRSRLRSIHVNKKKR